MRGFHGDQRQQLKQVVRQHVAQRAGGVVEAAAVADPELLLDRDLHVIDVIAVPDRLEHAVREPQHQDVLDRFLPEIVVDPIDLPFVGDFQQVVVERLRRLEIGAERLLDHEPPPHAVVFAQHPATSELPADRRERIGRSRE